MNAAAFICIVLPALTRLNSTCAVINATKNGNEIQVINDCGAKVGLPFPEQDLEGVLMLADPIDACIPINKPPHNTEETRTKNAFALIQAGACDYRLQIYNAQFAEYDAAIIYNTDSKAPACMKLHKGYLDRAIVIPSAVICRSAGEILKQKYLYFNKSKSMLQIFSNVVSCDFLYNYIPFLICCLIFLLWAGRCTARCGCWSKLRRTLIQKRLKKLPVRLYVTDERYDRCAICLEDYKKREKLRFLPCHHAFHRDCIDSWLTRNYSYLCVCPLCKQNVFKGRKSASANADSHRLASQESSLIRVNSSPRKFGRNCFPAYGAVGILEDSEMDWSVEDVTDNSTREGNNPDRDRDNLSLHVSRTFLSDNLTATTGN